MKALRVVAAVIWREGTDGREVFATQRGYGDMKGGWEFPGGKIEVKETSQDALRREIREEMGAEIEVGDLIGTVEYDYPTFHLSMDCFWCKLLGGYELKEHSAAKWLRQYELNSINWLPADLSLIEKIKGTVAAAFKSGACEKR